MKPAPRQIDSILAAAVELDSEVERRVYLEQACAGDAELKRRLEELIENHFQAGSFLEHPAVAPPATGELQCNNPPTSDPRPVEGPGTRIGPYKLLQQIGEGGMGVVYMAEQEHPVRRRVALKIIKPGLDSKQVVARFEAERQALAMMDHLHIAKVLDAGTTDTGRPYFVMELVHGVPITQFCDDHQLTPRERLQLFVPVCQAIQHAHQKGIIHRDIKPSNVLVTLHDDKPVPKVIDFGVAKAIEQRLTEKTLFTQFGAWVGTFEYMSPEQAQMNDLGVDTRSDIYSLGVLLYELLTGSTPLERERLRQAALDVLVKLIKEEEPPRPSVRLSSSNNLPKIAAARKTEPAKLAKLVRGEIDWIVMKCLEKNRSRRYETANGLARDVERYLHDEPVEACPPSAGYRLRKFARKYRMPMTVAAAFALLLVVATVVAWLLAAWALAETRRANDRALEASSQWEAAQQAEGKAKEEAARAQKAEQERYRQWYAATSHAMQQAWDSGQVVRLRTLLAETERYPDRGFEWYYFQRLCHLELQTFIGHRAAVTAVSWSPDGKRLATGSKDGTAKVWDAASGQVLLTFHGHTGRVATVCWSPDGKWLATGSEDFTAKVWEAATGRELLNLKGHRNMVTCLCWSPDGKRLATASGDQTAKVWETAGGRELFTFEGHKGPGFTSAVLSVSWSPDSKQLATGSNDGTAKVWEASSGHELRTLRRQTGPIRSVCWSPDGKWLATGSDDGTVRVWDVAEFSANSATGREPLALKGHASEVLSVSWSPDSKQLATGSADGTAKVWDVDSERVKLTVKGHTNEVLCVSWSPDGKRLATGSQDGTAKVWEAVGGLELRTLKGHSHMVHSVCWSPDGKRLATGSHDDTAKIWETASCRELFTLRGHRHHVTSTSWSPDGKRLATGSWDLTAKLWDAAGGQPLRTLEGHTSFIRSVSWSPDGKWLATGSNDGTAKIWDPVRGEKPITLQGHTGGIPTVAWSPDGKWLATGSEDRTAKIWEAASGRELFTLKGHTDLIESVSWSPDGKWLATGSEDGTTKIWEIAGHRARFTLKGHTGPVWSVSWSIDNKRLATGSRDGTAKIWDAASGRQLLNLQGHTSGVWSVSWSPDGKRLATGSADGTAKVWEAAGAEVVEEWVRQDGTLMELLALNAYRGPDIRGFIQSWLLLLPIPFSDKGGALALDRQQLPAEAHLRPRRAERARVEGKELVWQEYHSPEAVLDFNAVLGRETNLSVAYAVCYLESNRPRNDLWLQVAGDDQAKVYLNGQEVYKCLRDRPLDGLDTVGPVVLEQGTNVLVFKVANEYVNWQGCARLVDAAGRPAKDIRVKLTPE
jgi:WD40 repeat protein/serine/threonine protein kinase